MGAMVSKVLVFLVLAAGILACGNSQPQEIKQTASISECGGFPAAGGILLGDPRAYCDAEVLSWSYQEDGGQLSLIDSRVLLNCCGDHAITLAREGDGFLLSERDAPKDGSRCRCECVFDFRLDAEGVPAGTLLLRVVREITDDDADPVTLFDGALDLSIGAGNTVLDETDASAYCGTP